ncbi:MAG: dUTP diphosphatase [Patescibacteria group bacterium]|jgi:dUTP pyrophosphatase
MNDYPGKFIVFYGINNLGKSTQAKLLVERLKANGYQAEYLKYPIYELNPSGEILNNYLRRGNPFQLSPREAQIIYALNRDQYQTEIIKKLKSGVNIIAEDYKGTGIAWGLGAGVDERFLKKINSHLISEDLVFLFDGERFREAIENGHHHENNDDLMNKVRWAHLKLREEYGWLKINANLAIEEIHEQIFEKVRWLLEGSKTETRQVPTNNNLTGFKAISEIINVNHKPLLTDLTPETVINPESTSIPETTDNKPTLTDIRLTLLVEKLNPQAKLLQKAHAGDAGYDLYANDFYSISPYGQALVTTGLKMAIPEGYVGLIWDKSGLAFEGLKTMGGVIDSNYRGEVKVVVKNLGEEIFNIVPGQKVAQILIQAVPDLKISAEKINDSTDRGTNNFGSSGKF